MIWLGLVIISATVVGVYGWDELSSLALLGGTWSLGLWAISSVTYGRMFSGHSSIARGRGLLWMVGKYGALALGVWAIGVTHGLVGSSGVLACVAGAICGFVLFCVLVVFSARNMPVGLCSRDLRG